MIKLVIFRRITESVRRRTTTLARRKRKGGVSTTDFVFLDLCDSLFCVNQEMVIFSSRQDIIILRSS